MKIFLVITVMLLAFIVHAQTGTITSIAGSGVGAVAGDGGPATTAKLGANCMGLAIDRNGNVYYASYNSGTHVVRKISTTGIITTVAGNGSEGYSGDGGPATAAQLKYPFAVDFDTSDNLYISESEGARVRKVAAGSGIITTIVGNGITVDSGDGGLATASTIRYGRGICFDKYQNMYIGTAGGRVRKVDAITGVITRYAGDGTISGFSGDGGLATNARFSSIYGICTNSNGDLFVADRFNTRIRKIDAHSNIITTFAGTDSSIYNGEGLLATSASISPWDVAIDVKGNLLIAEGGNYRIRKVNVTDGRVYTIAGIGVMGFSGDGGRADSAQISIISGIAVDECDNVYFTDAGFNNRIRKITYPTGNQPTITITSQGGSTLCYPMPITFTAHTTLAGRAPIYEWRVNGAVVGGSTPTYTYTPAAGDSINCILTSNLYCVVNPKDTSNTLRMNVFSLAPPTLSLSGTSGAAIGDTVTISAAVAATGMTSYRITWENKGTVIATTFTPTLRYVKPAGDDTLTATLVSTSRNCYDSVVSAVHVVRANVGVNTISTTEGIALWPNPTSGTLHYSGLAAGTTTTIAFYDLVGRQLLQTSTNTSNGTLNITTLPTGIYIAQITDVATGLRVVRRVSVR